MAGGPRLKGSLSKSCVLLIVISGMERFAFKGVASNLVTYLTDVVKMSNSSAAKTVNNWCGLTSIMPLLVAPLADSLWDHYFTILASSFFYIMGLVSVTYTAFVHNKETTSSAFLFMSLSVISIGQGAYNPALQAFAADQLGGDDDLPCNASDEQPKERSRFFTMWYFGICAGSLLGVSLMAYVQDSLGWGIGFAIPTLVMVLSIMFFSCGTRMYSTRHHHNDRDRDDNDRPWKRRLHSIKETLCKLTNRRKNAGALESKDEPTELELQKRSLCGLDFVDTKESRENRDGGLESAKVILRLLPIWTMLLIFAVIFQQPATFFTKQGMTMKRNFSCKLKIPPATLQSAITVSIIILMPLYDRYLIPLTKKISGNEKGISVLQRMGVGMILSTGAMIVAALVEEKRLQISKRMGVSGSGPEAVPMNIFWLLPQYILLGIADIFTVVGMQEFFYGEVPVKMRTMGIALYTSVFGVGSFMSAVLISMVELFTSSPTGPHGGWFADDMSEARIDKYYWLLALLSALSFVMYAMLCRCYTRMKE